jgi:hypothetical protein
VTSEAPAQPEQLPAAGNPRAGSRQRAVQLSQRVAELERENARLREQAAQWVMHHAHAAHGIRRLRDAIAAGNTDPGALMAIINDGEVNAGSERFVAYIVDGLVTEWTREPIPNVTRSEVRDWLIAHRMPPQ